MSPQRRTALVSVGAACALIALKLAAGIPAGSLGLVSEALHSGTDLVAALLTFFAVGVAVRPADEQHQYGQAEHAEQGDCPARGVPRPRSTPHRFHTRPHGRGPAHPHQAVEPAPEVVPIR